MKLDIQTGAAIGFAAFAGWYAWSGGGQKAALTKSASDAEFERARRQRNLSGAAQADNTSWITQNLTPKDFTPNTNGVDRQGNYTPFEG